MLSSKFLIVIIYCSSLCFSQYIEFSNKFNEVMASAVEDLTAQIMTHPDYVQWRYPDFTDAPDKMPIPTKKYIYSHPDQEDYQIGILIDPCRNLSYNCCLNYYGTPEYLALRKPGLESERVVRKLVLGNDSIIEENGYYVYENGDLVNSPTTSVSQSRMPDDDISINTDCKSSGVPLQNCVAYRIAKERSHTRPACTDNNNTLDASANCTGLDGNSYKFCIALGFSQNAFISQCNENYSDLENCGTYLEIHLANGSPYVNSEELLSEVPISANNVSGYFTTNISLTWQGDPSKILCSYTEHFIRVGSLVYVLPKAPKCCCPLLRTSSPKGAFLCPIAPSGGGPFAARYSSVADSIAAEGAVRQYPYCHGGLYSNDSYMCSVFDPFDQVWFTRPCVPVQNVSASGVQLLKSHDLNGTYNSQCPYFDCCAISSHDNCNPGDSAFTFRGRVGKVVAIDPTPLIPRVWVTFNGGRSSYVFNQDELKLETYQSMYEVCRR